MIYSKYLKQGFEKLPLLVTDEFQSPISSLKASFPYIQHLVLSSAFQHKTL